MNNKCLVCIDVYTVRAGDTLYSIANRYNVSTGLLMRANMIDNPYDLRIGLKLCIPGYEDELPAAPGEGPEILPTPSVPAAPPAPSKPQKPQAPSSPSMPPDDDCIPVNCKGTLYTVEKGDTLYMIAKKFRVNLNAIIDANPTIDPYNLRIGMQICIPR